MGCGNMAFGDPICMCVGAGWRGDEPGFCLHSLQAGSAWNRHVRRADSHLLETQAEGVSGANAMLLMHASIWWGLRKASKSTDWSTPQVTAMASMQLGLHSGLPCGSLPPLPS